MSATVIDDAVRRCDAIWGKSPEAAPYPLAAHLLDSWVTAGAVWDHWLRPGLREHLAGVVSDGDLMLARRLVQTAALLHDVGKANPVFQTQAADRRSVSWRRGQVDLLHNLGLATPSAEQVAVVCAPGHPARRHEYVSGVVLGGETPELLSLADHWLIQSITGHHGRWRTGDADQMGFTKRLLLGDWGNLARRIKSDVVAWAGGVGDPSPVARGAATQAVILTAGLVMLADWTASLETNVSAGQDLIATGLPPGSEWVCARTAELTDSVLQTLGWYTSPADPQAVVMRGKSPLRPLQNEAVAVMDEPGLWIVTYPTGEGKTEAALLRHMGVPEEGLIFALPTRATTNAMQTRLAGIFSGTGNQVIVSHQFASRQVCATAGAAHGTEWYDTSIRRLVAPVVAATCDQVLSGALRGKHAALRLTALANKHVIVDEVHTFDHYQSALLTELMHWWGATGTRVTLLSATLPVWQQRDFEAAYRRGHAVEAAALEYPGSRLVRPDAPAGDRLGAVSAAQPDLGTVVVSTRDPVAAHIEWVAVNRRRYPGANLGVVVNTVDRAIAVAGAVDRLGTGAKVICVHSRFALADRCSIEADLLERLGPGGSVGRQPVVLVGTQVLEASLDIDLDLMSTDICPAPSLLQRAGRCQRFRNPDARARRLGGAGIARVLQVVADPGEKPLPYLTGEIDRVAAFLAVNPAIKIPGDVQRFVDDTTFDMADWTSYMDSPAGREEIGEATKRLTAANRSRAQISKRVLGRADRYGTLVDLTNRDDGDLIEDVMGTRYIDRASAMYIFASASQVSLMHRDRDACLAAVDQSIPVNAELDRMMQPASRTVLARAGLSEWSPRHPSISMMRPVDPEDLPAASIIYDAHFGLRRDT